MASYKTEMRKIVSAYEECLHELNAAKSSKAVDSIRDFVNEHFDELTDHELGSLRSLVNHHDAKRQRSIPDELFDVLDLEEIDQWVLDSRRGIAGEALEKIGAFVAGSRMEKADEELTGLRFTFPAGVFSDEVTEIVNLTYGEALEGYRHGFFLSAIVLCGKVQEVCVARTYEKVCGEDSEKLNMSFDAVCNRLKNEGYTFDEGLKKQMESVWIRRNKAVHGTIVIPTRDQARGVISLTRDTMQKIVSKHIP